MLGIERFEKNSLSLLDNAPNYLVGSVIPKRYPIIIGRPRRDRTEMHKELFLKKRSRKGLLSGPPKSNLLDFDFNLEPIESEESGSSGDETYLVPSSKAMAKSMSNYQNICSIGLIIYIFNGIFLFQLLKMIRLYVCK